MKNVNNQMHIVQNWDVNYINLCLASFGFWLTISTISYYFFVKIDQEACYWKSLKIINWIISSIHATVVTVGGIMVVINTKQDLIHAQHIYTNPWACEVGGYFAADLLILFYIQWIKVNKDLSP